jgi:hypothetical protein
MNPIYLNGIKVPITLPNDCQFHEVMKYLSEKIDPQTALITSVKINGNEVSNTEDGAVASTPWVHLDLVEVFTSHPKELANETLYNLVEFSKFLETQATTTADCVAGEEFQINFNRLIDGISTFTEAISEVKRVLKLGLFNSIQNLESELLEILKTILKNKELDQTEPLIQLLREDLVKNIIQWREAGLPSLIRSRDS